MKLHCMTVSWEWESYLQQFWLTVTRLQYKRSFVTKMEQRMQQARYCYHQTGFKYDESFFLQDSTCMFQGANKKTLLNRTAPCRFTAEIYSLGNDSEVNNRQGNDNNVNSCHSNDSNVNSRYGYDSDVNSRHGNNGDVNTNSCRGEDSDVNSYNHHDINNNYATKADTAGNYGGKETFNSRLNFSSVFRWNTSVVLPVLETSFVFEITNKTKSDQCNGSTSDVTRDLTSNLDTHNSHLTKKFLSAKRQAATVVTIQEHEDVMRTSEVDSSFQTPLQSPDQQTHRKQTRKKCNNENCKNVSCTCVRHTHTVRRSKSQRLPRNKPPRHALKSSRSVVLVPVCQDMENRPAVNDTEDGYGVTLHVPALTPSSARSVHSRNQDSESEDEVTLIAENMPVTETLPVIGNVPVTETVPSVDRTEDIHRLGTMLCRELRSTTPVGKRENFSDQGPVSPGTFGGRSRQTSSNYSVQTSTVDSGKRRLRKRSSGQTDLHGGAGSSSPGSSRPVSEVFSLSSEYYSRATSSDHIYHDVSDYSEEDYITAAEMDHRDVYTPYSGSEPDQDRTRLGPGQIRATSTSSFHNIISTIDDLEQKLGPDKHEDLRFLRDILQNDRLSALHHALKSTGNKNFTQSTPHLGNIHVTNENTLGGHSSKLAASSYNWEQVRQPDTEEDEDVVTIRFTKTPEQSLGATIVEDKRSGAILIKRILEESPIAACNKIHPGDELKMINNMPVAGKTVEEVREMLGRLSQDCTLTVSSFGAYPEDRESYTAPKSRYFRAFFNYDPKKDTLNPCKDASFSFELGDILEVVNTEDESWWQAKKYGTLHVGLVPSSDQRLRYLNSRAAKASSENLLYTREHNKKLKKKKDFLFTFGSKDHKEPLTYIEVTHVRPSRSKRRPIIITGAKNFGGSCIRKKLLHNFPDKYSLPIKHTTKTDTDGYKSCSKKEFTALIKQRDLIEYTKSGGHYYGTSYESVRELIVNGKICLLDVHPQYLPVLCNGTLRPHVIFVEAASEERIKELKQTNLEELPVPQRKLHGSDIRELRFNSERLLRRYTEFVDTIITLESLTSAVDLIDQVADRIINHPAWMPRRWLEST
ncbi:hypothetical protein ACHWQZ_G013288 [Mnemiopsis leidyi]